MVTAIVWAPTRISRGSSTVTAIELRSLASAVHARDAISAGDVRALLHSLFTREDTLARRGDAEVDPPRTGV
jgi:hypothetical protein